MRPRIKSRITFSTIEKKSVVLAALNKYSEPKTVTTPKNAVKCFGKWIDISDMPNHLK